MDGIMFIKQKAYFGQQQDGDNQDIYFYLVINRFYTILIQRKLTITISKAMKLIEITSLLSKREKRRRDAKFIMKIQQLNQLIFLNLRRRGRIFILPQAQWQLLRESKYCQLAIPNCFGYKQKWGVLSNVRAMTGLTRHRMQHYSSTHLTSVLTHGLKQNWVILITGLKSLTCFNLFAPSQSIIFYNISTIYSFSSPLVFHGLKTYYRKIMQQSTIIHISTRKISMHSNTPAKPAAECRICLAGGQENNELVAPCGCTGSVEFVHEKCFNAWIRKKAEDPQQRQQVLSSDGLDCQICHQRYRYFYELVSKWATFQVFKKKILARRMLALATTIFILVDLVLMGVMVDYAVGDYQSPDFDIRVPRFFLVYIALTFATVSGIYGFWEFKSMFLVYQTFEVRPDRQKNKVKMTRGNSTESGNNSDLLQQSNMRMQNSGHFAQYV